MHMHLQVLSSVGRLPSSTVGAPGTHGDVVAGMQGIGVSTPIAAEVAEATVGFASEVHMPNGMTFSIGTVARIVAAGWLLDRVRLTVSTTSDTRPSAKLHIRSTPLPPMIP